MVDGGDSAIEEATFLTRFADKVTLIHRRKELRASKIMQDRAFANPKIEYRWNSVVEDVKGDGKLESIVLRDAETDTTSELAVSGMFVAIGHDPNTSLFRGARPGPGRLPSRRTGSMQTSVPGVYAGGDVQERTYKQAVTAAGTGCMAALEAEKYIEALGDR